MTIEKRFAEACFVRAMRISLKGFEDPKLPGFIVEVAGEITDNNGADYTPAGIAQHVKNSYSTKDLPQVLKNEIIRNLVDITVLLNLETTRHHTAPQDGFNKIHMPAL